MTEAGALRRRARTLVVTGLLREARLLDGLDVAVVVGGGSRPALEGRLHAVPLGSVGAVVSFGLAGGLAPDLNVGDLVVGTAAVTEQDSLPADAHVTESWTSRLDASGQPYRLAHVAGVDRPVLEAQAKAALQNSSRAAVVDMESHVAAAFARARGLPFGILRVVSDGPRDTLPAVVGAAMNPDGSISLGRIIAGLARNPSQLPSLLRTGRHANVAFRRLRGVRGLLSPGGGLLGLDL